MLVLSWYCGLRLLRAIHRSHAPRHQHSSQEVAVSSSATRLQPSRLFGLPLHRPLNAATKTAGRCGASSSISPSRRPYLPINLPERNLVVDILLAFTSFLRTDKRLRGSAISVLLLGLRFAFRTRLFSSPALHTPILHQVCRTFTFEDSEHPRPGSHRQGARTPFTTFMVLSMS